MKEIEQDLLNKDLTQKDIIQLLLHNAQHMATRDEVKSDIRELRGEIKNDIRELRDELKEDISKVESTLKQDISKLDDKISKVSDKFDKIQWLIIATLVTVVFKDYIFSLLHLLPVK